ncbi:MULTISPECIES: DPP IV N-terminal domain-containing protein [unclassified Lentimicrobium]|uniref:S9 family peptidase n=1 Tax=unclassified Lentimicrobium TaxID=2677434 RepID=UPI0020A686AE|nr:MULTISPECIES: DPP IV N-terminal domain-containing protein [unclassified Lentimicrobium]
MNLQFYKSIVLTMLLSTFIFQSFAQKTPIDKADYRMAERFSPTKIKNMVFSLDVRPKWLESGDKFWYTYKTTEGTFYYLVDLEKKSKKPLFDNHHMATQLTLITKDPYDLQHLPDIKPDFEKGDKTFRFDVTSTQFEEKKKEDVTDSTSVKKEEEKVIEIEEEDKRDDEKEKDGEIDKKKKAKKDKPKKKVFHLEYNIETGELKEIEDWKKEIKDPDWANISPNDSIIIFARDYNLYWMDYANYLKAKEEEDKQKDDEDHKDSTIVEYQITNDGVKNYGYGGGYTAQNNDTEKEIKEEMKKRRSAWVTWSQDSKKFSLIRSDDRHLNELWVIDVLKNPRPKLETYKYQMPGEKDTTEVELLVFDAETKEHIKIQTNKFKNQWVNVSSKSFTNKEKLADHLASQWISESSDKLYFTRSSRDLKKFEFCVADLNSGEVSVILEESMNTYLDTRTPILFNNEKQFIHWSERTGWGHFYLYDIDGTLVRQLTSGPWKTDEYSAKVDEKTNTLFFTAQGKEANENPYYTHQYSVSLKGGDIKLLNTGNYYHSSKLSDSYHYFINNYSRVNTTPKSEIRDRSGNLVMELETADLSSLFAAGYKFPEPFKAKAADGITDIYGVMYKPFKMDSTKTYPILEYVYPGPQTEAMSFKFSPRMDRNDRMAQLGFVVISLGNRGGSPNRSQWYHTYGYGDLRDYGLADKKYVVEQLADRFDFIDIDKVGISGHSGGGFMSTAALLQYPDFYKVAVSSAGNHENNIYNRWWSERHHGVEEKVSDDGDTTFVYQIEKNSDLAKNLKGHLMLVTGDIDNNVHPGNTLRMANALIKANKRFDLFIMTGQRHGFGGHGDYFFWRKADYFCRHLIGDYSISTDIFEMNREHKATPSKKRSK